MAVLGVSRGAALKKGFITLCILLFVIFYWLAVVFVSINYSRTKISKINLNVNSILNHVSVSIFVIQINCVSIYSSILVSIMDTAYSLLLYRTYNIK